VQAFLTAILRCHTQQQEVLCGVTAKTAKQPQNLAVEINQTLPSQQHPKILKISAGKKFVGEMTETRKGGSEAV
jgi:hypothetical protein